MYMYLNVKTMFEQNFKWKLIIVSVIIQPNIHFLYKNEDKVIECAIHTLQLDNSYKGRFQDYENCQVKRF